MAHEIRSESRRSFIRKASAGAVGIAVGSGLTAASYRRVLGSNERVRVGIIGFSDRAKYSLIPALAAFAPDMNFEITAVSDIWNRRRDEGVAFLASEEGGGFQSRPMRNNEELYESGLCDAVIVSTADFQHALHTVEAIEGGCDVYSEKPFANTMADANLALDTVSSSDRVFQIGTQRRSAGNYRAAYDYLRSGSFGEIVSVDMTWNVNQPGRWRRPDLVSSIQESDTDWTRYLMNRPFEPWDPRKYVEYRLFWPYSSGIPGQWMVHQIDTVHWFTGLPHPRSVAANGGIYLWNDGRRSFDTMTAVFDYGPLDSESGGFHVVYASRQTNSANGVREVYYSNGGALNLDTNMVTSDGGLTEHHASAMDLQPFLLNEKTLSDESGIEVAANTGVDGATLAHMRNWMECIRSRKSTNGDIHAAYNHSVALCMTIAALHTGKRITFDSDARDVVSA